MAVAMETMWVRSSPTASIRRECYAGSAATRAVILSRTAHPLNERGCWPRAGANVDWCSGAQIVGCQVGGTDQSALSPPWSRTQRRVVLVERTGRG